MLEVLAVDNYRSLRSLRVGLGQVTVITGSNGSGKSNLYRALTLLHHAANGELARALALEGGMPSIMWAGPERAPHGISPRVRKRTEGTVAGEPKRVAFGFKSDLFGYELRLGLPPKIPASAFARDPLVKEEWIWTGDTRKPSTVMLERSELSAHVRDGDGARVHYPVQLDAGESVLAQLSDPHRYPEVSAVREQVRRFRFYHHFRVDEDSPLRRPQIGTRTHVLGHDGRDLAAAVQTIFEIGDEAALQEAVREAFDGAEVVVEQNENLFSIALQVPGLLRPLAAAELSDGTLRFLCLLAAMTCTRPPELLVLNEPEASLHPRLFAPLGKLVTKTAARTQLIVVSHARELVEAISADTEATVVELEKQDGETIVRGQGLLDAPAWPRS